MNGDSCIMSPNINKLKQNSPVLTLHGTAPIRNAETPPEARLISNPQPTEFSTPDHTTLASVPEGSELNTDSVRDQCKPKYSSCSSSTPIKYLHRTPPSRNKGIVVTNPFDVGITERLHLPVCSPSVFAHVVNPSQDSPTFRWNIDNLSKIYPADIEEFPSHQYDETLDPEVESKAQEAINRYFCKSQQLLPSPWGPRPDCNDLRSVVNNTGTPQFKRTPLTDHEKEENLIINQKQTGKNVWTQTILTLPPILPPSVELALKPFFTFTAEQQQCQNTSTDSSSDGDEGMMSTSSLRRKLFFNAESPSSTSSSPKQAHMSMCAATNSPICSQSVIVSQGRTFGSPLMGSSMLSPLALSPVLDSPAPANRSKSVTRLTFSQEDMAMDVPLTTPLSPGGPHLKKEQASKVGLSPLGAAPLHDKDTDDESVEQNLQNNKWSRRNKRNLMDVSTDSLRLSPNCTPVKSNQSMETSLQNVMDISQGNLTRTNNCRETAGNFQETTFGYSQTIGASQDTGYGSSCDGTGFQSGAASLFGLSLFRDKLGCEDSLATTWQPRNVVSSTPTKTSGTMANSYPQD